MPALTQRDQRLHRELVDLQRRFDPADALARDPLGLVRAWPRAEQEVVAHIAGPLAYGAIPQLRKAITAVLAPLGSSPRSSLERFERGDFVSARPDFRYRMTGADDIDAYLAALATMLRAHGTLEAAWRAEAEGELEAPDSRPALECWVRALRRAMVRPGRGARYLTPDPATGSATKRWHLLLRWLVRPDEGTDLGLWTVLQPSQLVFPLDTHTSRLAWSLRLTTRRSVDYRMAREVTDRLQRLVPEDPLRHEMALCHLGIAGACRHRWVAPVCSACALRPFCRWGSARRKP